MAKSTKTKPKRYVYSPTIKKFLDDELRSIKLDRELDDKINAGENVDDNKFKELNKTKGNLRKRKSEVLDGHIFPSMANLVLFFEYLAKSPELRNVFEDDLKELFGYIKTPRDRKKEDESEYNERNNILRRLIQSLFTWDMQNDPNNFRLGLIDDIQYDILRIIVGLALRDFSGDFGVNNIVDTHMGQAVSWAKLYGSRYYKSDQAKKDKEKIPRRPILF
jgi:hypothetical protein